MANKQIDVTLKLNDKLTGPMGRASKKLQEYSRQYQRIGRSMIRTGEKISSVGSTLTKTITAPIVGLGAIAFKEFGEYDKQMRLVQQTMGSTEEESKNLGEAIKESAKNSVYGMQDAADAALNYARAGYTAAQAADMLTPAFNLAAGTGTELEAVTAGLAGAIKGFSADTKEAAKYADIFQKAQAQAMTTTQDLFDATQKASSVFANAGWTVKDLAVATGILGDAQITGAEAGTALKSGFANLIPKSKDAAKWFEQMGLELTNSDGTYKSFLEVQYLLHDAFSKLTPVQKQSAAVAIFGKHQYAKWLKIIERSPEDVARLSSSLDGVSGDAQNAADALMSGPGGALEKLKSNWDIFKNTLGETLAPVIAPMVEKLTEMLQAFSNLTDEQKQNIIKWVGIAAAVGPCLLIFGKFITLVGTVIKGVGLLGKTLKGAGLLGKIFAGAGGVGAALPVLGAIAGAIALVAMNWDKITAMFSNAYQKIKPAIEKIYNLFKKVFGPVIQTISDIFVNALGGVIDKLSAIVTVLGGVCDFIAGIFTGNWKKAWEGIKEIFAGIWDGIVAVVKTAVNTIISVINFFIDGINAVIGARSLSGKVKDMVKNNPALAQAAKEKGIDVEGMSGAGGLSIPTIPTFGVGVKNFKGGLARIHDKGGEVVDLPRGSRVYPHDKSVAMAYEKGRQESKSMTVNIPKFADQIIVRQDADIDMIATKLAHKLEKTSLNLGASQMGYQF